MDSRDPPPPQPQPQPQPQLHPQPPPMMMATAPSYPSMMAPATARFPFNTNPPPPPPPQPDPHFNDAATATATVDAALKPCALPSDSAKKKRGRPRKYSPDGNIALGLAPGQAPTHAAPSSSAEPLAKKHRGRPLAPGRSRWTPSDIAAKLMAFCQQGFRTVCILSATGAICNVTLRQSESSGGGVSYEGQFEIISLSGSTRQSENNNGHSRMTSLVQIIVGSFIADSKKSSSGNLKSGPTSATSSQMLTFGGSVTPTTPTSQGHSTESSDDNENGHFSKGPDDQGLYTNQSVHNIPMYHHQLWTGQTQQ
ncbi:hypothetical protein Fmac_002265 [Flemingia macrophylla]|uniref:AT-hook motif nuclear-localized protein n=1 Tax=Flemingia macrophylla TaxID=520843 RepID=A0ABD1NJG2_9FABA